MHEIKNKNDTNNDFNIDKYKIQWIFNANCYQQPLYRTARDYFIQKANLSNQSISLNLTHIATQYNLTLNQWNESIKIPYLFQPYSLHTG